MPTFESYRKQAKLLVRWHRERNFSVAGRLRQLPRFTELTDRDALAMAFPLALAQEIVAFEAGRPSWADLKRSVGDAPTRQRRPPAAPNLNAAIPILFVRDVTASAEFYRDKLGFKIDFVHGAPPFYGAVSRGAAVLHLKFVDDAVFGPGRVEAEDLIMAFVPIDNIKALCAEYRANGVSFSQEPTKQAWGGTDFHVIDPDGNRIAFVE
jgi:catechol 2,3-dioxygenase-like lactoylglutathione lyase family enzyme